MLFYIIIFIIFLPFTIIFPIKKIGKNKLKKYKGQNFIIACNHMSNLDPIMLDITFGRKFKFLAKKELFKNKLIGACMRSFGGIPVDRQNPSPSTIKQVFSIIDNKKHICIFPQGTRKKQPIIQEGEIKDGVAMFAVRTGTPVLPMMFNKKIKAFHRTKLYIGEPIFPDVNRKKDKDYILEFSKIIESKMNELLEGENK